MERQTALFYCQHLLGVGHICRSLAICRALLERFDVVFIQGGPDIGRTIDAPGFEHVFLPPLLMRESDSTLYDPAGRSDVDDVWAQRQRALQPILVRPFAAVLVELFPFGRNKFKPEILNLITRARSVNPGARVYCSNRDIMVQKRDQAQREQKIVRLLREYFDCVLVHSDPELIAMDETFSATQQLEDMIRYTGYVADGIPPPKNPPPRDRRILVSLGGGAVGEEVALACLRISNAFPSYEMRILTGPYTSELTLQELAEAARGQERVRVEPFSECFRDDLARSELSISLAGYNTLMDILATRTPALVYPYMANLEQNMRARALERQGLLRVLSQETLTPEPLIAAARERLAAPRTGASIDLTGAQTSAEIIAHHLAR